MTGAPDQGRWRDAVQDLFDIQADCQVWPDNLPDALKDSTLAERPREVCELDPEPAGRGAARYLASPGPASDAWAYPSGTYAWAGWATPLPTRATKAASIVKVSNHLRSIDVSRFWCMAISVAAVSKSDV